MRFVIFTHSLVSDWNHGNAHFLRGVASELVRRGNNVRILEPANGWSRGNLTAEYGENAVAGFENAYPLIRSDVYDEASFDLHQVLHDADAVIVHEWNSHELVRRIGEHHKVHSSYRLYFHDTHHRSVTEPASMSGYDLTNYDGVLAYGNVIRDIYQAQGWARQAWTWHEAADTEVFHPLHYEEFDGDLVWIGNWGDDERTQELREFLIEPVKRLRLKARVYGVRYPRRALDALDAAGIQYGGWLPNYLVPQAFARYRVTIHVPRRPYASVLRGIPTIRPFEAMACGIPMISAPWQDEENLFRSGKDFLFAEDGDQMTMHLENVLSDRDLNRRLSASGVETIRSRHTCAHRVDQLFRIINSREHIATVGGSH